MRTGNPTLEAVAREAQVSRATVSRVVNGSTTVDPKLVERVRAVVERMHYIPNRAARSLAGRMSGSVALLVPEDLSRFFADPFFAAILHGITQRVDAEGYVLNLLVSSGSGAGSGGGTIAKTASYLGAGNVDGVVVVSHHAGDAGVEELAKLVPAVFGGRPSKVYPGQTHYVDVDNVAGARVATRRLVEIGRRRIAMITGPLTMAAGADRRDGFLAEMAASGLEPVAIAIGDFTAASGASAMSEILATGLKFDGIFIASDLMALGAVNVLKSKGLRIPEDVAVVGFDDSPAAVQGEVQLTTIRQPSIRLGWMMADVLFSLLAGNEQPEVQYMDTELVIRQSA